MYRDKINVVTAFEYRGSLYPTQQEATQAEFKHEFQIVREKAEQLKITANNLEQFVRNGKPIPYEHKELISNQLSELAVLYDYVLLLNERITRENDFES